MKHRIVSAATRVMVVKMVATLSDLSCVCVCCYLLAGCLLPVVGGLVAVVSRLSCYRWPAKSTLNFVVNIPSQHGINDFVSQPFAAACHACLTLHLRPGRTQQTKTKQPVMQQVCSSGLRMSLRAGGSSRCGRGGRRSGGGSRCGRRVSPAASGPFFLLLVQVQLALGLLV